MTSESYESRLCFCQVLAAIMAVPAAAAAVPVVPAAATAVPVVPAVITEVGIGPRWAAAPVWVPDLPWAAAGTGVPRAVMAAVAAAAVCSPCWALLPC